MNSNHKGHKEAQSSQRTERNIKKSKGHRDKKNTGKSSPTDGLLFCVLYSWGAQLVMRNGLPFGVTVSRTFAFGEGTAHYTPATP
jgi:hypothetical protein